MNGINGCHTRCVCVCVCVMSREKSNIQHNDCFISNNKILMGLMSVFEAMMIKRSRCFFPHTTLFYVLHINSDRVSSTYSHMKIQVVHTFPSPIRIHQSVDGTLVFVYAMHVPQSHGHHVKFMKFVVRGIFWCTNRVTNCNTISL